MNLLNSLERGFSLPPLLERMPPQITRMVYPCGPAWIPRRGVRNERLQFPEYTVKVPQDGSLKAPVRLLFLSDIHMDELNVDWLMKALPHLQQLIKEHNIDALLFGGDYICQGGGFIRDLGKWVESLSTGIPMIGIMGNHDYLDAKKGKKVKKALKHAGVRMLVNKSHIQSFGNRGEIAFHGLDDYLLGKPDVNKVLANIKTMAHMTNLALIHNPKEVETSPDLLNHFPLIIAGHTHGGQVVGMFHWLAQLIMKQRYIGGLYIHPKKKGELLVGKGMGTGKILLDKHHHPRLYAFLKWLGVKKEKGLSFALPRFWEAFSEVSIINLVPEGKSWNA
jgi:predicted MPP superfamily phosphohydrolase